jgi:hypothetical protein
MPETLTHKAHTPWTTKQVNFFPDRILLSQREFPMIVSDSSVEGGAGQFRTLCDIIAAAEGCLQQQTLNPEDSWSSLA